MYKYLFSAGTAALFVSALALSAQDPEQPARPGSAKQPAATPSTGVTTEKAAPVDKNARRRSHGHCYLGVYTIPVEDLSRRVKKRLQIKEEDGVVVVEVMADSPAEEAGLRHGDVITHVNGKLIEDEEELVEDLNELGPGKNVTLSICRDGKKKELSAKLEEGTAQSFYGPTGEEGDPGAGAPMTVTSQERLRRIERLERKILKMEKRIEEMEREKKEK
jgi:membrane-associated protease RseP (regulator of RpoE activity)